ncbi:MAG: ASKHA domain-containing protein [Defluviitaleaceae bacterium]|nr:ASKHA domain-containing protein [Defluviitaleaceae bacterium]
MVVENVLTVLHRGGIPVPAPCGGKGICGKCIVIVEGKKCLACQTAYDESMTNIEVEGAKKMLVVSDYVEMMGIDNDDISPPYVLAIDIGTTTLAFELLSMSGAKKAVYSSINSQHVFGADVVTRISKALEGNAAKLNAYIIEDISTGIAEIIKIADIKREEISRIGIVGNTTMLHLLRNLPCDTLGVYPFTPVTLAAHRQDFDGIDTLILPGISTFVGADITAGISFCRWGKTDNASLLIDLGTNGELALFTQDKILVTSTAAGPAFEAGNISQGVGSISGAIARVNYLPKSNVFIYETVGESLKDNPVGICGTGVIDITAELIRHNLVDETGRLEDESDGVMITKDIAFTQKDIREVQLAKSAVRSGIEILLEEAGLKYEDISKVFLAGGFGYHINVASAATLGLIPAPLKNKVQAIGNAALGGCAKTLLNPASEQALDIITATAKEINLATHPRFNTLFMEYMGMETEL